MLLRAVQYLLIIELNQVRLDPELQELYIVSTAFNGPADRAGLQVNDVIVSIDGLRNLAELPISRIGTLLTGDAGSNVEIEVKKLNGPMRGTFERMILTRQVMYFSVFSPRRPTDSLMSGVNVVESILQIFLTCGLF